MPDPDSTEATAEPGVDTAPGSPSPEPIGPGRHRARSLRWAERLLLVVAAGCLGSYLWATLDARIFQAMEERRLERELSGQQSEPELPSDEGMPDRPRRVTLPFRVEPGEPIGRIDIPRL